MGTKLYVGNLNYNTSEQALREAFGANGREVASVSIIMDRETGRPRGFAFVEMTTPEFAQQAMQELDGTDLEGRMLRMALGGPLEDLLDQAALVEPVVYPVRAQVVLDADIGRVPLLHRARPGTKGLREPNGRRSPREALIHGCHR